MAECLICLGRSNDPETRPDRQASLKFKEEWNKLYPSYPVRVRDNPHDFGAYASVEIDEEIFSNGLEDTKTFPTGIEETATALADTLGLDY